MFLAENEINRRHLFVLSFFTLLYVTHHERGEKSFVCQTALERPNANGHSRL